MVCTVDTFAASATLGPSLTLLLPSFLLPLPPPPPLLQNVDVDMQRLQLLMHHQPRQTHAAAEAAASRRLQEATARVHRMEARWVARVQGRRRTGIGCGDGLLDC